MLPPPPSIYLHLDQLVPPTTDITQFLGSLSKSELGFLSDWCNAHRVTSSQYKLALDLVDSLPATERDLVHQRHRDFATKQPSYPALRERLELVLTRRFVTDLEDQTLIHALESPYLELVQFVSDLRQNHIFAEFAIALAPTWTGTIPDLITAFDQIIPSPSS